MPEKGVKEPKIELIINLSEVFFEHKFNDWRFLSICAIA